MISNPVAMALTRAAAGAKPAALITSGCSDAVRRMAIQPHLLLQASRTPQNKTKRSAYRTLLLPDPALSQGGGVAADPQQARTKPNR